MSQLARQKVNWSATKICVNETNCNWHMITRHGALIRSQLRLPCALYELQWAAQIGLYSPLITRELSDITRGGGGSRRPNLHPREATRTDRLLPGGQVDFGQGRLASSRRPSDDGGRVGFDGGPVGFHRRTSCPRHWPSRSHGGPVGCGPVVRRTTWLYSINNNYHSV